MSGHDRLAAIRRDRKLRDGCLIVAGITALGFAVLVLDPVASGGRLNVPATTVAGCLTVCAAALSWFFHLRYLGGKGT